MDQTAAASRLVEGLFDRVLPVFDEAVALIPDDRLRFRATPDNMTAAQMAYHAYRVLLVYAHGAATGAWAPEETAEFDFDPDAARSSAEIVQWAAGVAEYARRCFSGLDADALRREAVYDFGRRASGWVSLVQAYEEILHHRGQMMIYLRLMGRVPPRVR